ncbi:MAG: hypothetical protein VXW65_05240 [Pseudomonadota bacterium]|nr:hypothetical protein [Pseudomonadota bacterium]
MDIQGQLSRVLMVGLVAWSGSAFATTREHSAFAQVHAIVFAPTAHVPTPAAANAAATTAADRALFAQIQQEVAVYAAGQLPHYPVTASQMVVDGVNLLRRDAERTLREHADFYPRLEKRLHANGICFAGRWQITADTPYSGYFKQGAQALWLGRASVSLSETERGQPRGFAMAGKLFPTLDPHQPVPTAHFFVADVLSGTQQMHYLQTAMTNQPRLGFRWSAIPLMFQVGRAFAGLDRQAGYRPVTPIAALGEQGQVRAPKFLMIRPAIDNPLNDAVDFRDELNLNKAQVRAWHWEIWVSDHASKPTDQGWQQIGQIVADQSIVSYGCDRQLHFAHPRIAEGQ